MQPFPKSSMRLTFLRMLRPLRTASRPWRLGALLLVLLGLLPLEGCRDSVPPVFSVICLGDGIGGADCSLPGGASEHLLPSQLKNFWMTTNADMQNYTAWCYQTTPAVAAKGMSEIAEGIRK